MFVGGFLSYLCYLLCLMSFSPVVCRRVPVLFMLFVVFDVRFLSPVVCRRVPVLFMLFVVFDVRFVFLSSCL